VNTLGWKSVVASLGAHALVIAALVRVPARAAPMADAPKPLEVSVVAVPAPAASETAAPGAGAAPARPVRAITGSVPHRAAPARPEPPPRAGGQPKLLSMRGPTEVHVPAPWQIGQPEGPPAADQLPPAALGAPLRAPAPSGVPLLTPGGREAGTLGGWPDNGAPGGH